MIPSDEIGAGSSRFPRRPSTMSPKSAGASFPPAARLGSDNAHLADLGVELGDISLLRATSTLRRGRYADGFEVGVVTLNADASASDRWHFEHGLEVMLAHEWEPGIVPIRDVGIARDSYAIACATGTLADLQTLDLTLELRLRILRQVGLTLSTLHASGCVHGCLAAHNVILTQDLSPVLDEVAMVELAHRRHDDPARILDYRAYAAPEATSPGTPTPAGDVYAWGRLLELMIGGERPVPGTSPEQVARRLGGRAPPSLIAVVATCLATDATRRYPNVGAVLEAAELTTVPPLR